MFPDDIDIAALRSITYQANCVFFTTIIKLFSNIIVLRGNAHSVTKLPEGIFWRRFFIASSRVLFRGFIAASQILL